MPVSAEQISDDMIYVYALPTRENMTDGYCFGGGKRIEFLNLDWFNAFDGMTEQDLRSEVSRKVYMTKHRRVLVLCPERQISMFVDAA